MENLASQYTVLVVDDVPTNVMLVQAILKKEGYTLLTTDSGAKALRIAQERHPNLILLDIMMHPQRIISNNIKTISCFRLRN